MIILAEMYCFPISLGQACHLLGFLLFLEKIFAYLLFFKLPIYSNYNFKSFHYKNSFEFYYFLLKINLFIQFCLNIFIIYLILPQYFNYY
jgi:hypothetical protein